MTGSSRSVLLTTSAAPRQTPFSTVEKRPPIGIGFLIAMLRNAGHTVHFVDNYLSPTDLPDRDFLLRNRIEFVGIYCNTICFRHSLAMMHRLEYLRQTRQWHGKIMVGGPHTTVAPETIPDFVDFVVQGEGEHAIVDIVEDRVGERIVRYPRIGELDALPMPAWDVFAPLPYNWECNFFSAKPVFSMNTSRGCPFRCAFCSVCSVWGKRYSVFSADRIVEDIGYLAREHGAGGIYFREDNFTLDKERLDRFCRLMIERDVKLPWVCESRVNTLTRELVGLMARAGAKGLYFGVESGSQRMLDLMEKDITVEQVRQAFAWCRELGIATAASVIVGVPEETPRDVALTRCLLAEIKPTVTWCNAFVGIPVSKLYRLALDRKLYEFIDDRGLVYLTGHDERARRYYGNAWDASVPVKFDGKGVVNPLISVVMSVYNAERCLERAVQSVLAQSEPNFEFIIVDDGSADRTAALLRGFGDRRIKIITNGENIGLTRSLIKGIAEAKGRYIARMDGDDLSLPHRFETQVRFLESHPECAAVGSSFYTIDESDCVIAHTPVRTDYERIKEGLLDQNWFCHGVMMIRREAFEATGGYNPEYRYSQDYEYWLRMSETHAMANIEEPLYRWRSTAGCISREKGAEQKACADRAREEAKKRRSARNGAVAVVKEHPVVSVIVPTFNRPQLLGSAIQSVLNQTYPHYEIIVVNDGGAPGENIAYAMNKNESIVYVRRSVNGGLAAARNTGLRIASGDFIAYLDDDDMFYPTHLETLMTFLDRSGRQAAYSDAMMASQHFVNGQWETKERRLVYSMDFNSDIIFVRNLFPVLCIVHAKKCIDEVGAFDETLRTHEDWDLWIRMSRKYRMHHIKTVTAEYTVRESASDQMTKNPGSDFCETRKRIFEKYAPLVASRPDIRKLQEAELEANDPRRLAEKALERLQELMGEVSGLVERGELRQAVTLYEQKRNGFVGAIPELDRFDALMAKVRVAVQRAVVAE